MFSQSASHCFFFWISSAKNRNLTEAATNRFTVPPSEKINNFNNSSSAFIPVWTVLSVGFHIFVGVFPLRFMLIIIVC